MKRYYWQRRLVLLASLVLIIAGVVLAAVTTIPDSALIASTGYYTDSIGGGIGTAAIMTGGGNEANVGQSRNDDGFEGPINLGFTLNFFGVNYTQFWANNNGNVSFGNGIAAFTPNGPQGATQPDIAPFFADVDTTNPTSGVMYVRTDIPNEVIVTWDMVGYFDAEANKLDSFQLVLRGPSYNVPAGEGQIGFWYKSMQWETGDASGGTNGLGGTPAAVGFGDGNANGEVLQGSIQNGISGIVANHHIWFNLSGGVPILPGGTPTPTPAPASWVLMAIGVAGLGYYYWQRGRRREV